MKGWRTSFRISEPIIIYITCKLCKVDINVTRKQCIERHCNTKRHRHMVERNSKQAVPSNSEREYDKKSMFCRDLCAMMVNADIPLNKLNNKHFREFLEMYTKEHIPSYLQLRQHFAPILYEEKMFVTQVDPGQLRAGAPLDYKVSTAGVNTQCLICHNILKGRKKQNTMHHYESRHKDTNDCFVAEDRNEKVQDLKAALLPEKKTAEVVWTHGANGRRTKTKQVMEAMRKGEEGRENQRRCVWIILRWQGKRERNWGSEENGGDGWRQTRRRKAKGKEEYIATWIQKKKV
ncbi:hypothetical protein ANN_00038 [Periplaneta americana]|uniref:Uncharacterized protein n=1 Tax=Periplaneta americana TaxID=6978 RepID=A0ABQ8TPM6_PERAM|nr:hypothetical protein ANN_00038 [Periplaneta americana]